MRVLFIVFALLIAETSFGQSLKFKVLGQADDTVHLVRYFGKGLYYADTA